MGSGLSATPLVKHHNAVALGVEELARFRGGTATGAAVDKYTGLALGVTRLFKIDFVAVTDVQPAAAVGFNGGVQAGHGYSRLSADVAGAY